MTFEDAYRRDGGKPALAEAEVGDVDEGGLPEQETIRAKAYVRGSRRPGARFIQFAGKIVEKVLSLSGGPSDTAPRTGPRRGARTGSVGAAVPRQWW